MRKVLLLSMLGLMAVHANAADYYWVGGGGSWSDLNHWRLGSSSGSIPSIVPSAADNVLFTSQSGFTASDRTVNLDANGFCNNMTWNGVANSPSFNATNISYAVQVNGNLGLSPTTTYNARFIFKGATAATLTANGTVLGEMTLEIDKPGGSLSLADNLNIPTTGTTTYGAGGITFTAGSFNMSGKTVYLKQMYSDNTNTRVLNMTNTTLTTADQYRYTGTNKTLTATGSVLSAGGIMTDAGTYARATSTLSGGPNTNLINSTTFSALTFTGTGLYSDINNSNTVDTLVFAGPQQAFINGTNTIGSVSFNGTAIIASGNTIRKVTALNNMQITGTNTIDSLILAPNKVTTLAGTINISGYMKAQGTTCQAFTEITAADSVRLMFGPGATTLIDNVFLTNIKAYGNNTPIAVSGVDGDGNTGFNITAPASLTGTNLYWVGGAGDWNDNTHWSYTSGGAGGACIPFIADTVIFNSASGLGGGQIVTTSGSSYCYNMNWVSGVGTTSFNEITTSPMNVYGSVSLTPAVTMNAMLEFAGTESTSTITTNGSTLGSLRFHIRRKGAGAVTLVDNWNNSVGIITQVSGAFKMPNRTVNINRYTGNTNGTRFLDISNATITVGNSWDNMGGNKTINATGSVINTAYGLHLDGLNYPVINATYNANGNPQAFDVAYTTIGQLTFSGTHISSGVNIDSFNTIRRLEFKGAGAITGSGNVIDTLLLAGARTYQVTGTSTINKYLFAQSALCSGLLEIRGNTTGGFQFNPATVISMNNVYLQNMAATGVPAVPVTGADAGGNTGWNITAIAGSPRYWIGGSGDWNDNAHWSMTSGGAGGACIPTPYDNVFFDANSGFTAISKTVTVNNGNAYCRNLNWAAATNAPIWTKAATLNIEVWGDTTVLNPAATFNVSALSFISNNNAVISGSALGNFDIRVSKVGGSLKFLNNYTNTQTDIYVNNGTLDLSGRTMSLSSISNEGLGNTMGINISNANITLDTVWQYNGPSAAHTLNAAGSTINTEIFNAQGLTYNNVNVSDVLNTSAVLTSTAVGKLTFTNTNTASLAGINGTNNSFRTVEYKGGGGVYGTGNMIDTMIFFPGNTYTFTAGTNTTINNAWYGSGTPCRLTEILSSSTGANATVTMTNGDVTFDYVRLRRITAAGAGAPFVAQQHSTNLGNNTNWNIATYNGAAPIYGLGPDTALLATAFPYTLHTDGFFGAPSSQYTWNNSSTADSLVITDTGVYSVTVNFVDGCTISDNIHVTLATPLPVTLMNFEATAQHCQTNLDWTVANAVNFNRFVVERSQDGRNYKELGLVQYANGKGAYTYTDNNTPNGKSFYRLRLVDADGMYAYSKTLTIQSDCRTQAVAVYPTLTKGMVYISLPAGYANAEVKVYTIMGQVLEIPGSGKIAAGLNRIDLSGMAQGAYLLKVGSGSETQTFKVVYQP